MANAEIFSFFFGIKPPGEAFTERKVKGQGSGFCVDGQEGVILTNAHVPWRAKRKVMLGVRDCLCTVFA